MLDSRLELRPEPPSRRPAVAWKLVVAAEAPWTGEIYHTRPGGERRQFSTVETFCRALLAVTGWPIQGPSPYLGDHSATRDLTLGGRRSGRRAKPRLTNEDSPAKRKFIVSADEPWTGDIYRTRPGLGHFRFGTFEGFLRAVLDLTNWTLEGKTHRNADCVTAGPSVSQPTSGR